MQVHEHFSMHVEKKKKKLLELFICGADEPSQFISGYLYITAHNMT